MITVRYPSGIVVTYNDANFLTHDKAGDWALSRRVNGNDVEKIAFIQASAGVIVEFTPACKAEQSALTTRAAAECLSRSDAELRALPRGVLAALKKRLVKFNARSWRWK